MFMVASNDTDYEMVNSETPNSNYVIVVMACAQVTRRYEDDILRMDQVKSEQ